MDGCEGPTLTTSVCPDVVIGTVIHSVNVKWVKVGSTVPKYPYQHFQNGYVAILWNF